MQLLPVYRVTKNTRYSVNIEILNTEGSFTIYSSTKYMGGGGGGGWGVPHCNAKLHVAVTCFFVNIKSVHSMSSFCKVRIPRDAKGGHFLTSR